MEHYIVINTEDKERFEELKKESGLDFSKKDARFIKYYNEWLLPVSLLNDVTFKDFKNFLEAEDYLKNGDGTPLNIQKISDAELQTYYLLLEEKSLKNKSMFIRINEQGEKEELPQPTKEQKKFIANLKPKLYVRLWKRIIKFIKRIVYLIKTKKWH
jgi:hypothetical protein